MCNTPAEPANLPNQAKNIGTILHSRSSSFLLISRWLKKTNCFVGTGLRSGFALRPWPGRRLLSPYCVSRHRGRSQEEPRATVLRNAVACFVLFLPLFFFLVAVTQTALRRSESLPCLLASSAPLHHRFSVRAAEGRKSSHGHSRCKCKAEG